MNTEEIWDNYGQFSHKTTIISIIIGIIGVLYHNYLGNVILLLTLSQYLYMTIFYEVSGILKELEKKVKRTYWHILPSVILFYIKSVLVIILLLEL